MPYNQALNPFVQLIIKPRCLTTIILYFEDFVQYNLQEGLCLASLNPAPLSNFSLAHPQGQSKLSYSPATSVELSEVWLELT